jgi:hypothetical protein
MTWLLWRQHRLQAAFATLLLAALGILLAITGLSMAHEYHVALDGCARPRSACDGLSLFQNDGLVVNLVNLTVAVPLLIGVFWGATSVGREYESGTTVLAWTQSVPRRRWLRDKVLTVLISSVLAGVLLSGMVTWWSGTLNTVRHNRFEPLQFDLQGLMPVVYTLFAAGLGLFAGVLWRRVVPAIATTVGGFVVVRLAVEQWARPHFAAPVTTDGGAPSGAWGVRSDLMHFSTVVTGPIRVPDGCVNLEVRGPADACMARYGYHATSTYQPASRYWTFQWIETGIFVGITALLVTAAVVLVLRRDA